MVEFVQSKEKVKSRPCALNTVEMLRMCSSGLGLVKIVRVCCMVSVLLTQCAYIIMNDILSSDRFSFITLLYSFVQFQSHKKYCNNDDTIVDVM